MKKILAILFVFLSNFTFGQNVITTISVAEIYDIPEVNSKVLSTIPAYTTVTLNGMVETPTKYDKYFRVVYNGTTGWVYHIDICYNELYYSAQRKYFPETFISDKDSLPKAYYPSEPNTNFYNPYSSKIIQLTKKGSGTFTIPCSINGVKLNFIFDTGASDVSISMTEALFMIKNGYLKSEDIFGKQYYSNANGEISEGTQILIREIEFGGGLKIYNVAASVVENLEAPLLLGQSAISKLGKIQIDYINNTLTVIK